MRHAERNALSQSTRADLSDCRMYVTGISCNPCMEEIIARGIKHVVIGDVGHAYEDGFWEKHHFLVATHKVRVESFKGMIADPSKTRLIGTTDGKDPTRS